MCAANVGPTLVPGRYGTHGATERALEGRAPNTTCSIRHRHISSEFKENRLTLKSYMILRKEYREDTIRSRGRSSRHCRASQTLTNFCSRRNIEYSENDLSCKRALCYNNLLRNTNKIVILMNCNWVVTRWQWLFYMYTNMKKKK